MATAARIAPELTVSEQVRVEALAHGRRLECARQLSGTIKGPGAQAYRFADRIKAIADELDREDAEERRREEERHLRTPSALIARMRESWPRQSAAVRRLADDRGMALGEAWALVIDAGVKALTKNCRRKA